MSWMAEWAEKIAPHFIGCGASDVGDLQGRLDRFCEQLMAEVNTLQSQEIRAEHERLVECVSSVAGDDEYQWHYAFLGLWGATGMPVVHIEERRFAAAMMGMSYAVEMLELVEPPWPAFMVCLPAGSGLDGIETKDPDCNDQATWEIQRVMAMSILKEDGARVWSIIAQDDSDHASVRPKMLTERTPGTELCSPVLLDGDAWDQCDRRAMELVGTLVASVCMAFRSGMQKQLSAKACRRSVRASRFPTHIQYAIGAPIVHDVTGFVRNYIRTGRAGGRLSVQSFVRGHWKRQRHGEGGLLTKFIFVEPYWRGPEDASIAVRAHVLTDRGAPT